MRCLRLGVATVLLTLGSMTALQAAWEGVPLNDYTRLGQQFTVTHSFNALSVVVPSWHDAEGGLTLTLWDSPQRKTRLAEKTFTNVPDNASVSLLFRKPLPRGAYYWEVHDRTGQTRVGLYGDTLDAETEDCAYFDGVPNPKRRFNFSTTPTAFPCNDTSELVADLKSAVTVDQRTGVCRQLAVVGNREAVAALADFLADEQLSHIARYALEPMPYPAVDAALRGALKKVKGKMLIGVINSLGERRDAKAVAPLSKLLQDPDAAVASAAAVALGKIGTLAAANTLERAMDTTSANVRLAVYEGSLNCAHSLAGRGQRDKAIAMYDKLAGQQTPAAVRAAAMRGAVVAREARGVPILVRQLNSSDPCMVSVALWVVQHELPRVKVTEALAAELSKLPAERQPLLIQALSNRGDRAALAALLAIAKTGVKPVRLAAVRALPEIGDGSTVPVLIEILGEADAEVSQAARESLARLPGKEVATAVATLLASPEVRLQLAGVELAGRQRLTQAIPALLKASHDADPPVRLAALKVLGELGGGSQLPGLLDVLADAEDAQEIEAAEQALSAVCARAGDATVTTERLLAPLGQVRPSQKAVLLRLLAAIGGARALQAVRDAGKDPNAEVRASAFEALSEWKTAEAAPDLLELARTASTPGDRLQWLRSCLRIAGNQDVPAAQRLTLSREAATLVERDEEKKLLLGALAGIAVPEALALIVPYLDNAATKEEASLAAVAIAEKLVGGLDTPKVAESMRKVMQATSAPDLAKRAEALLREAEAKAAGK